MPQTRNGTTPWPECSRARRMDSGKGFFNALDRVCYNSTNSSPRTGQSKESRFDSRSGFQAGFWYEVPVSGIEEKFGTGYRVTKCPRACMFCPIQLSNRIHGGAPSSRATRKIGSPAVPIVSFLWPEGSPEKTVWPKTLFRSVGSRSCNRSTTHISMAQRRVLGSARLLPIPPGMSAVNATGAVKSRSRKRKLPAGTLKNSRPKRNCSLCCGKWSRCFRAPIVK